ncbi:hypothetical protein BGZ58_001584 [Dissophora ornata]|nr:hypothetical protein BGZ58_001584 [Dissophora ornata]
MARKISEDMEIDEHEAPPSDENQITCTTSVINVDIPLSTLPSFKKRSLQNATLSGSQIVSTESDDEEVVELAKQAVLQAYLN